MAKKRAEESKQRHGTTDVDLEPLHGIRNRRRHASKTRGSVDNLSLKLEEDQTLSPKCKTRRHLHREIERLVEENRLLSIKLEETSANPSSKSSELQEKDVLINRLRNKYHKLEKSYSELQTQLNKLQVHLEECKNEYNRVIIRAEESTMIISHLEQEKNGLATTLEKLKNENIQYNEDINLLKSVIYRLNVELERYQDKLRLSGHMTTELLQSTSDDISRSDEMKKISESWGKVNVHALGPLLDAYVENLNEKDELINKYKQEIDIFSGNCKEIVIENEMLNKSVEIFKTKCDKYAEELKVLEEDAIVIKEQNDLLIRQVNLQQQKLEQVHSVYELKVESMSQDNNKLHKEFLTCKTELSNVKGKYEILHDGYEKLKNNNEKMMPVSVHVAAVDECKRLFEELKTQYESEKRKLNFRIKAFEENHPENEKQLITITAERDQLKQQIKNLEKTLKRTQHKLECLQNAVCSMQISRDSLKRQLTKTTAYCEELVLEQESLTQEKDRLISILHEREKESEDIFHLGDNIAQRMGNLKHQLKSVQKGAEEQLATVEKQMRIQEKNVDQMKMEHYCEIQRLKHLLKQKEEVIKTLQKEKTTTQDNLELVLKAATNDDRKVKNALKNKKLS